MARRKCRRVRTRDTWQTNATEIDVGAAHGMTVLVLLMS